MAKEGKTIQDTGEECITWSFMNRFIPRQKYYIDKIKVDTMSMACDTRGTEENCIQGSGRKT